MKLTLYTDGGARNNPGPAGIGGVIYKGGKEILVFKEYIGEATNNQAEYKALIKGLDECHKLKSSRVTCYLDSQLVVKQLRGEYKIKNEEIKDLVLQIFRLMNNFSEVIFNHIPREKNKLADKLVNEAIDEQLKKN